MIRFLTVCILLLLSTSIVFAEDDWKELSKSGNLWDNQKPITDAEFEKVMERFEKNSKEERRKKKMGQELFKQAEPFAPETVLKNLDDDYPTIMIPCTLTAQGQEVPPGYYRIIPEVKNGKHTIILYQGNTLRYIFLAKEAHDFDYPEIKFSVLKPFLNDYMRIIVGNADYNIDVYLKIKTNKDKVYIHNNI